MSDEAQCAHLRIEYRTEQVEHDFGPRDDSRPTDLNDPNIRPYGVRLVTRGWWECAYGCGTLFTPVLPVSQPLASEGIPGTPKREVLTAQDAAALQFKYLQGRFTLTDLEVLYDSHEQLRADLAAARSLDARVILAAVTERKAALVHDQQWNRAADERDIERYLQRAISGHAAALPSSPTPATGEQTK